MVGQERGLSRVDRLLVGHKMEWGNVDSQWENVALGKPSQDTPVGPPGWLALGYQHVSLQFSRV